MSRYFKISSFVNKESIKNNGRSYTCYEVKTGDLSGTVNKCMLKQFIAVQKVVVPLDKNKHFV